MSKKPKNEVTKICDELGIRTFGKQSWTRFLKYIYERDLFNLSYFPVILSFLKVQVIYSKIFFSIRQCGIVINSFEKSFCNNSPFIASGNIKM